MSSIKEPDATIKNWDDFLKLKDDFARCDDTWVFRGQTAGRPLQTSLERECCKNSIPERARELEEDLINEFRRQYTGSDQDCVWHDTLYCLALMRHHRAPTRLLDWTYSPYVAFFNALESWEPGENDCKSSTSENDKNKEVFDLWCMNSTWCCKKALSIAKKKLINQRNSPLRNNKSFEELYLSGKFKDFVFLENPFFFNERLKIQQGVFLCPGDVFRPLDDVLIKFAGDDYNDNIIRISCMMDSHARWVALNELHRMNINRASLYPGIDGMATSLVHRLLRKYEPSKKCPSE